MKVAIEVGKEKKSFDFADEPAKLDALVGRLAVRADQLLTPGAECCARVFFGDRPVLAYHGTLGADAMQKLLKVVKKT